MTRRKIWGAFALLAFALLVFLGSAFYEQWEVYARGSQVSVRVVSLPEGPVENGTLKFEFRGSIHATNITSGASPYLHVGDTVQLKYLAGDPIFLFPDDNPAGWGSIVLGMILGLGACCVYYMLRKDPPPVRIFGWNVA